MNNKSLSQRLIRPLAEKVKSQKSKVMNSKVDPKLSYE